MRFLKKNGKLLCFTAFEKVYQPMIPSLLLMLDDGYVT